MLELVLKKQMTERYETEKPSSTQLKFYLAYIDHDVRVHIKSFFWFYSGEKTISEHESRDGHVTDDKIEFSQNTLTILHLRTQVGQ